MDVDNYNIIKKEKDKMMNASRASKGTLRGRYVNFSLNRWHRCRIYLQTLWATLKTVPPKDHQRFEVLKPGEIGYDQCTIGLDYVDGKFVERKL